MDEESLPERTCCMFMNTRSDIHRLEGEREQAIATAELALGTAIKRNFKYEIKSAEKRKQVLRAEV